MTTNRVSAVTIEGTRLVFRNFSGEKGKFNKDGRREFGAVLPRDLALQMKEDGWNVKQFRAREDDVEEPDFYILVKLGESGNPPKRRLLKRHTMPSKSASRQIKPQKHGR